MLILQCDTSTYIHFSGASTMDDKEKNKVVDDYMTEEARNEGTTL